MARIPSWLMPTAAALVLLAAQPFLSSYLQDLVLRIVTLAIFALSLELLVGTTGLVSLGHAAFYGIGAYATVMLSPPDGPGAIGLLLPAAAASAALYAVFVGALSLRTKGVYFIMVTLAFAQMAYFVFHDTKFGGGTDGIYLNVRPVLAFGERVLLDTDHKPTLYWLACTLLIATYALLALIRRARFGHALAGIRVNEQRMRAAGFPTTLYKLAAFVIAAALAGVAGFLAATKDGVVNPELLSWHVSGEVLLVIILGGLGHLRGAVLGAVAFVLLKELLSTPALAGPLAERWQLTLGFTVIAFVALLPKGLIGLLQRRHT
ncbi:branched-chain amino acid ABC transporter permease [Aquincola sp. S2]|uniref:Branched-chain amino acid ABC transporter permease n=1 Tax=Pseudaquabacterium terrae TaxID=2732868 RepID=A0ABX2EDF8_9BURK|nr:branched-chain amino acid ABC transporter permease [Aquabacterium terrae]NRF66160.1 branched-chain amino acid ABC transporter permease [Aquabacterium terrae]